MRSNRLRDRDHLRGPLRIVRAMSNRLLELDRAHRAWLAGVTAARRVERKMFSDSLDRPILRESLLAYLDSLGTKARVRSMTNEHLRDHLEVLDALEANLHSDLYDGSRQRLLTFSDNVAVACPLVSSAPADVTESIVKLSDRCADYQLARTLNGTGLRGAIALGDVFCDDRMIDGPALVDAVVLEETVAKVPRIVFHGDVVVALANSSPGRRDRLWPRHLFVRDDSDDTPMLNYLLLAKAGTHSSLMPAHAAVVRTQLQVNSVSAVRRKWLWVARYHNWFIDQYVPSDRDLRISRVGPASFTLL